MLFVLWQTLIYCNTNPYFGPILFQGVIFRSNEPNVLFSFGFLIVFLWAFVQIASPANPGSISCSSLFHWGRVCWKNSSSFCIKTEVWEQMEDDINTFYFGEDGIGKWSSPTAGNLLFFFFFTKLNRVIIIAKHFNGSQMLIFSILFSRK